MESDCPMQPKVKPLPNASFTLYIIRPADVCFSREEGCSQDGAAES